MKPNSTAIGRRGRKIEGISLRDEPWEEAEKTIRKAWKEGYRGLHFDNGLLLFKPDAVDQAALKWIDNAYTRGETETEKEAVEMAKRIWWVE